MVYIHHFQLVFVFLEAKSQEWIEHQDTGSSVTIQLPPHWCGSKVVGFTLCAVIELDDDNNNNNNNNDCGHNDEGFNARCECHFKNNYGDCFDILCNLGGNQNGKPRSDHVFLWYTTMSDWFTKHSDKSSTFVGSNQAFLPWHLVGFLDPTSKHSYNEAIFESYLKRSNKKLMDWYKVKKYGVHLQCNQDENECHPTIIQTSSFYDPLNCDGIKKKGLRNQL